MFGSGVSELLLVLLILLVTLAPVILLVILLVWAYRRVEGFASAQEDIRRRLAAIEEMLGKGTR